MPIFEQNIVEEVITLNIKYLIDSNVIIKLKILIGFVKHLKLRRQQIKSIIIKEINDLLLILACYEEKNYVLVTSDKRLINCSKDILKEDKGMILEEKINYEG